MSAACRFLNFAFTPARCFLFLVRRARLSFYRSWHAYCAKRLNRLTSGMVIAAHLTFLIKDRRVDLQFAPVLLWACKAALSIQI